MYPQGLHTRRLQPAGQFDRAPVAFFEAAPQLHGHGHARLAGNGHHGGGHGHGPVGVAQERRARSGPHHLAHRAPHVDIKDVRDG